ncbi:MAG TPA: glycosyltransferase [Acidobacteriaceae bacterium]|jgi:glycosyltransferase involved in cell wall biosynthesis|nr:glycosyltransferase [Acidobacteriaceae bacterium]
MSLTVLNVAFPFSPVGPGAVGGAEQILWVMDEGLTAAGHVSLVAASEGSEAKGRLFPAPMAQADVLDEEAKRWARKRLQAAIDHALESGPVDVVHMHGMDFHEYTLPEDVPVVVTLHMPVGWYPTEIWERWAGRAQFVCVSETQRRTCPDVPGEVRVVENGVALPAFDAERRRGEYALVLGRICPEKNAHEALKAGTRAGTRVLLGGQVFPYAEHRRYFEERVKPALEEESAAVRHEFLGPLEPGRREALLAEARCLLHPTLAPETSSLVAMEAMAVGTPVIAYRSGALPEVVQDGVTGFLVGGVEEMAAAMGRVDTISREACRRVAEERFSRERMVRDYLQMYEGMARRPARERRYA